ncbi:MAG: hypothetical protein LBP83_00390 [Dysgonamonadaceae bacterium]|nr:hypothetical protein [Dysgonamonadaceae bacterium]
MSCSNLYALVQAKFSVDNLPEHFMSYHATDKMNYIGKELYDYINGGAELYLSYGLASMTGCKYIGDNDLPQVTVEIYEMTSSFNAFGVYTQSRDKEEQDYGQGSQSFPDFILFWKDRYFVIVNTMEVTSESEKAIKYLAGLIDKSIPETGKIPPITRCLPEEGLVSAGFLYFHHYIWLNAYFFIADYDIININEKTDAILAKYGDANARSYLLIVEYPDEKEAMEACEHLRKKYAPELSATNFIVELEDETWFTVWIQGNKLGAIFNGSSRKQTEKLFKDTINNM